MNPSVAQKAPPAMPSRTIAGLMRAMSSEDSGPPAHSRSRPASVSALGRLLRLGLRREAAAQSRLAPGQRGIRRRAGVRGAAAQQQPRGRCNDEGEREGCEKEERAAGERLMGPETYLRPETGSSEL